MTKLEDILNKNIGNKVAFSYETPSGEGHTVFGTLEEIGEDFIKIKASVNTIYVNKQTCSITELGIID